MQDKVARRAEAKRSLIRLKEYITPTLDRSNKKESKQESTDRSKGNNGKKEIEETSNSNHNTIEMYERPFRDKMKNKKDKTIRIATLNVLHVCNHNWRNMKEQEQLHTNKRLVEKQKDTKIMAQDKGQRNMATRRNNINSNKQHHKPHRR